MFDTSEFEHNTTEKALAEAAQAKIAEAIASLMKNPEWLVYANEVKKLETLCDQGPEVYWKHPDQAAFDAGMRYTIRKLLSWCDAQQALNNDPRFAH